jgi:hypothetical protein
MKNPGAGIGIAFGVEKKRGKVMLRRWFWLSVIFFLFGSIAPILAQSQGKAPPVYITLWFDTEDYILPQSDDAAKRLAEILTRLEVKGTFKMVGEKARTLEKRGRTDVIRALQKHEIGYHTDFHSRQPTMAVYLQNSGWEDGAAEFLRREKQGALDVQRIFGTPPVCFGQPGSSWAPQAYAALRKMGITAYLDEASHIGIDSQPFYYGGLLNIFNLGKFVTRMELKGEDSIARARESFRSTAESLRKTGGGTVSIYYHPCEFVHAEFWDGVNFSRGSNPAPADWKLPPVKPAGEIERGFADFESYVRFLKNEPGVAFKTIAELSEIYSDRARGRTFSPAEIRDISNAIKDEIGYVRSGPVWLSGGEIFSLLVEFVNGYMEKNAIAPATGFAFLEGPGRVFEPSHGSGAASEVPWSGFASALGDVRRYCRENGRIPSEVWIGAHSWPPADFLASLAPVAESLASGGRAPATVARRSGRLAPERHVARDNPGLWGWVIFPEGFHAPALMDQARLQAWTLKPAVRQ